MTIPPAVQAPKCQTYQGWEERKEQNMQLALLAQLGGGDGFVPPFLESLCYFCQQLVPLEQWQVLHLGFDRRRE